MKDNTEAGRGGEKRFPLDLDTRDPEAIASLCLRLGYDENDVMNTLVQRCSLDRLTARQYVYDAQQSLEGGSR